MSNKAFLHYIMVNIIINASKPIGNVFNLSMPDELRSEVRELWKEFKQENGTYEVSGNTWIL